jgi:hypothetical protein
MSNLREEAADESLFNSLGETIRIFTGNFFQAMPVHDALQLRANIFRLG